MKIAARLIILLFLACLEIHAQPALPFMEKFFPGKQTPQFFDFAQDKRGVMYFNNIVDIITYDGNNWGSISMEGQAEAWSMAMDENGTIWLGQSNDLGFLKPDVFGKFSYVSLKKELPENWGNVGQIYEVECNGGCVYFMSPDQIYVYREGKFRIIETKTSFQSICSFKNGIAAIEDSLGILEIEGANPKLIFKDPIFQNVRFHSITADKEKLLLGRNNRNQIMVFDGSLKPMKTDSDPFFSTSALRDVVKLSNGHFAVGTAFAGLLFFDEKGEFLFQLNNENGLSDNYINNLFVDMNDGLWVSTDKGLNRVEYPFPLTFFDPSFSPKGLVSSVAAFGNELFVGTTQGLFIRNKPSPKFTDNGKYFSQVDFIKGDVLDLVSANGDLLVAGSNELSAYDGNNFYTVYKSEKINKISWSEFKPQFAYTGLHEGIAVFKSERGKWKLEGITKDFKEDISSIAQDKNGLVWVSTSDYSIYSLDFSEGDENSPVVKLYEVKNNLAGDTKNVFDLNGELLVGTSEGLFSLNPAKNIFEKDLYACQNIPFPNCYVFRMHQDRWNHIWISGNSGKYGGFLKSEGKYNGFNSKGIFKRFPEKICRSICSQNDGSVWFATEGGLFRYFFNDSLKEENKIIPVIYSIRAGKDSILEFRLDINDPFNAIQSEEPVKLAYSFNSLTFNFGFPEFLQGFDSRFSFFLEDFDNEWSAWSSNSFAHYTNIPPGNYKIRVRSMDIYGKESEELKFSFTILPPWYRTVYAYFGYFILISGVFYGGIRLNSRRLEKEKKQLEKIVLDRTMQIVKQKEEIQGQKEEIEKNRDEIFQINKDLTDSIRYAKRIQEAILLPFPEIKKLHPDIFVLYKPKDIVSGDFYWFEKKDEKFYFAAVDCTGHGVPGAFMSIVGYNLINQAVNEGGFREPAGILNEVNRNITSVLRQTRETSSVKDGMDLVLGFLDKEKMTVEASAAFNSLWIIRNNELIEIKGEKFPVGLFLGEKMQQFRNHKVQVEKNDMIYLFSDGYADQFGLSPEGWEKAKKEKVFSVQRGKKFKYKKLEDLLKEISSLPLEKQKGLLDHTFESWKGPLEQVDDVLLIGIRV